MPFILKNSNFETTEELTEQLESIFQQKNILVAQIIWQFCGFDEKLNIDNLRQLQAQAQQIYQRDKTVFYVLNLNRASNVIQNALLKIVEEPPKGVDFVLVSTNGNLLDTLQSRCQLLFAPTTISAWQETLDFWQVEQWTTTAKTQLAKQMAKKLESEWKALDQADLLKNTYAQREMQKLTTALLKLLESSTAEKEKYHLKAAQLEKILAKLPQSLIYLQANVSLKNVCYDFFLSALPE
ncbi:MAG: hypothetical protein Q4G02_02175 [bacterium]|nr:hypothetical protein [bacterium]